MRTRLVLSLGVREGMRGYSAAPCPARDDVAHMSVMCASGVMQALRHIGLLSRRRGVPGTMVVLARSRRAKGYVAVPTRVEHPDHSAFPEWSFDGYCVYALRLQHALGTRRYRRLTEVVEDCERDACGRALLWMRVEVQKR